MAYLEDYMDEDLAYLTGLIIARGVLETSENTRRLVIHFPYSSMDATGINISFDQETSIRLGLNDIRERLTDLLDTDIQIIRHQHSVDLIVTFIRKSMIWRNILLLTNEATHYAHFKIPIIFFEDDAPVSWKREFLKGYGDAAGNIRKANTYVDGRYRVRLDILNYPNNWEMPVQLCHLIQEQLCIPVQLITWGHPNMGRDFREHQLNIFADAYIEIGFSFEHKQKILEELASFNRNEKPNIDPQECPGARPLRHKKPPDPEENNAEKLDPSLLSKHFDAYWQICKKLGCKRKPKSPQFSFDFVEDSDEA